MLDWTPIRRCEATHEIHPDGRIRRIGSIRALIAGTGKNGYRFITLRSNGVRRTAAVHRLLAEAFLPPPPTPQHEINHRDGNKMNNALDNLEWVTRSQNMQHAFRLGIGPMPPTVRPWKQGVRNPMAKLTDADVREIRMLHRVISQKEVCARFGVTREIIRQIWRGQAWRHLE